MTHQEIVSKVKTILNEHGEEIALSISDDRVLIKDYIEAAIPDAVVMLAQRGFRVNVVRVETDNPGDDLMVGLMYNIGEDGGGEYKDADFISLIKATHPAWKKDVTRLTDINSVEFAMAQNEFTRPKANSPMVWWDEYDGLKCAPFNYGTGENVAFIYNSKYNPKDGLCFKYIKMKDTKVLITKHNNIEPRVATAVCYMAAALVCGMFGDDNGKQRLSDISTNLLQ